MTHSMLTRKLPIALVLVVTAVASHAVTLKVHCGGTSGLTSITAALKILQNEESGGPDTIDVSGACKENVAISGFDRLTLKGALGASISDASGGTTDVLQMLDSSTVHVERLTLNGSVSCLEGSNCTFVGDTFQGSPGDGVSVSRSYADLLSGNVIQNSAGRGLFVGHGSVVRALDLTVQLSGDAGVIVLSGGNLTAYGPAAIVNNAGAGVQVLSHSTLRFEGPSIQGNAGDGIRVDSASEVLVGSGSVNNNGGAGVSIGDLSFVWFRGVSNVTGNHGGTDVVCRPQFSATRGALSNIGGGSTNCVEP